MQVSELLELSDEDFVRQLYAQWLEREPDAQGLKHHVDLLNRGVDRWQLTVQLLQGHEAKAKFWSMMPPDSIELACDWVDRQVAHGGSADDWLEFRNREPACCRRMPLGPETRGRWKFDKYAQLAPPEQYLLKLPKGRACGVTGAVLTPDNRLLLDLSLEYTGLPAERHSLMLRPALPPVRSTGETVALVASGGAYNYYYWMIDVVARFRLLRKYADVIDRYVVNPLLKPYQRETLDMLGIPAAKIVELTPETHLEADRLLVPSLGTFTGAPPRKALRFVRSTLLRCLESRGARTDYPKRVYVSRAGATHRRVLNEAEVASLLDRYGFVAVDLEEWSVSDQIGLFRSAECIVAPHGAGLANVLFCRPGTTVIELFCPTYIHPLYWKFADHVGADYYYLLGQGTVPPDYLDEFDLTGDIAVDTDGLRHLLNTLMGG